MDVENNDDTEIQIDKISEKTDRHLKKYIVQYCQVSTINGLSYLIRKDNIFVR